MAEWPSTSKEEKKEEREIFAFRIEEKYNEDKQTRRKIEAECDLYLSLKLTLRCKVEALTVFDNFFPFSPPVLKRKSKQSFFLCIAPFPIARQRYIFKKKKEKNEEPTNYF